MSTHIIIKYASGHVGECHRTRRRARTVVCCSAIRLFRSEAIDNDINLDAKIRPSTRASARPLHDPPYNTEGGGLKKRGWHDRRSTIFGQSEARRPFNANDDDCRGKYIIYILIVI